MCWPCRMLSLVTRYSVHSMCAAFTLELNNETDTHHTIALPVYSGYSQHNIVHAWIYHSIAHLL